MKCVFLQSFSFDLEATLSILIMSDSMFTNNMLVLRVEVMILFILSL